MRLVALDVVDMPAIRTREVRAFQPGDSNGDAHELQQQRNENTHGRKGSHVSGLNADSFDILMTVQLTGDW